MPGLPERRSREAAFHVRRQQRLSQVELERRLRSRRHLSAVIAPGRELSRKDLADEMSESRGRTLKLVEDLSDEQLMGPQLDIVNPLLWEIGHVAWFQEKWVLRHLRKEEPVQEDVDLLYDSAEVAHDSRWSLPLPSRRETLRYMNEVLGRILDRLNTAGPERPLERDEAYFHLLGLFHEDMHTEAFTYTRQTLKYPPPKFPTDPSRDRKGAGTGPLPGDVEIPGRTFHLGAFPNGGFAYDNEKWAHPVEVPTFRIARAPVTNAEFAAFVDDGGYRDERWWSDRGRKWRIENKAEHPVYWKKQDGGRWLRRHFDGWVALEDHLPVIHINWYEAEAYCNWAGRRLPSEVEWELAASAEPGDLRAKRYYAWGSEFPVPEHANLNWQSMDCLEVGACAIGESAFGCRQMIGNVWEWTAGDFLPYPGFVVDPYKEYSQPWFGTHKVLRGGCWTTRARLIRNTWRNYYTPERRDVLAGFRTCAREAV